MNFKCAPCLDTLLGAGSDYQGGPEVPDAVTMVPVTYPVDVGGGRLVPMAVVVPVCIACRKKHLGAPGANGRLFVS
jgi:hypothetical protein